MNILWINNKTFYPKKTEATATMGHILYYVSKLTGAEY